MILLSWGGRTPTKIYPNGFTFLTLVVTVNSRMIPSLLTLDMTGDTRMILWIILWYCEYYDWWYKNDIVLLLNSNIAVVDNICLISIDYKLNMALTFAQPIFYENNAHALLLLLKYTCTFTSEYNESFLLSFWIERKNLTVAGTSETVTISYIKIQLLIE